MSQDPEAPKPSEPHEPESQGSEAPAQPETDAAAQRPKYTPPSHVPPVSLDKDRENLTEPIPPGPIQDNPTIPLLPGAPPLPGTPQQPGQQGLGAQSQPSYQGLSAYQAPYGQPQAPYGQPPAQYGPAQPYGPGQPYAQPYGYAYGPPEPKGLSIASMVCGISVFVGFGFFILPQIAAVVLGHMGLAREPAGRGMALAGLIMGYVGIALTVAFIVFFIFVLGIASNSGRYT